MFAINRYETPFMTEVQGGGVAVGRRLAGQASVGPPVRLDVTADPQKGVTGWKLSVGGTF
ncbi:MAG: hypothetical protein M1379_01035 [Firmicutes bacterium]|nr:hypothetical protein [Bacillota bacterium]